MINRDAAAFRRPGTNGPGRIRYPTISLKRLLMTALDADELAVRGPGWLDDEFFEINAVMSPDTMREQFPAMLRDLLSYRFKPALHRETKAASGYASWLTKAARR
jgi:uncharacterized protein (TIGR03435 family)